MSANMSASADGIHEDNGDHPANHKPSVRRGGGDNAKYRCASEQVYVESRGNKKKVLFLL